jgi:hypothetical protein
VQSETVYKDDKLYSYHEEPTVEEQFHQAVDKGEVEKVRMLLDQGVQINDKDA